MERLTQKSATGARMECENSQSREKVRGLTPSRKLSLVVVVVASCTDRLEADKGLPLSQTYQISPNSLEYLYIAGFQRLIRLELISYSSLYDEIRFYWNTKSS